jgi:3'-phosphoadenosine 5'-phosphosulfate (PAPS) 3'-phosphatase
MISKVCIHFFKRINKLFEEVKSGEFKINVLTKAENEKFTEADWVSQKLFENYMEKYFDGINLVGEENTKVEVVQDSKFLIPEEGVNLNLIPESSIPPEFLEIEKSKLCVLIDPIDSTSQFIAGNYGPVTSMVGLTLNQEAFCGMLHFPLYKGETPMTMFNIPTKGVFIYNYTKEQIEEVPKFIRDGWAFVSSGSRTTDSMRDFIKSFKNSEAVEIHGLGNKSAESIINDYVYLGAIGIILFII